MSLNRRVCERIRVVIAVCRNAKDTRQWGELNIQRQRLRFLLKLRHEDLLGLMVALQRLRRRNATCGTT